MRPATHGRHAHYRTGPLGASRRKFMDDPTSAFNARQSFERRPATGLLKGFAVGPRDFYFSPVCASIKFKGNERVTGEKLNEREGKRWRSAARGCFELLEYSASDLELYEGAIARRRTAFDRQSARSLCRDAGVRASRSGARSR